MDLLQITALGPGPWAQAAPTPLPQAVCGYGSQEALPLRPAREGELYFPEDREVNLVDLALATNIPKGCAETAVRGDCPGMGVGAGLSGEVMDWLVEGAEPQADPSLCSASSPCLLPGWQREPGPSRIR